MRNLSKVVALVLALVMCFACAASAAFTDVTSATTYADSVNYLAELGVLSGDPDGNFRPDDTITRAEITSALYRAITGKKDGAALYSGVTQFADVPADHWANGFINWAVSENIIVGDGNGNFRPDAPVTFNEIIKMAVVALKPSTANSLASGYPFSFVTEAVKMGIIDTVEITNAAAEAPRGAVAEITYETIACTDNERFSEITTSTEGNKVVTTVERSCALAEIFEIKMEEAYVTIIGTSNVLGNVAPGYITKAGQVVLQVGKVAPFEFVTIDDVYGLDESVHLSANVKFVDKDKDTKLDANETIVDFDVVNSKATDTKINRTGAGTAADPYKYNIAGIDVTTLVLAGPGEGETTDIATLYAATNAGIAAGYNYSIDVIYNAAGKALTIDTTVYSLAVVEDVKADYVVINGVNCYFTQTTTNTVGVKAYDGIAKGDYVIISAAPNYIGNVIVVEKAATLSNVKLTAFGTTFDGTAYTANLVDGSIAKADLVLNKAYNLVFQKNGTIAKIYTDVVVTPAPTVNYIYVTNVGKNVVTTGDSWSGQTSTTTYTVTGVLADGTTETFTMGAINVPSYFEGKVNAPAEAKGWLNGAAAATTAAEADILEVTALFTYTLDSKGNIATLEKVSFNAGFEKLAYNATTMTFGSGNAVTYYAKADTVVYVKNVDTTVTPNVTTYIATTAGVLKGWDNAAGSDVAVKTDANGKILVAYVKAAASTTPAPAATTYTYSFGYVSAPTLKFAANATDATKVDCWYEYTVYANGAVSTLATKAATITATNATEANMKTALDAYTTTAGVTALKVNKGTGKIEATAADSSITESAKTYTKATAETYTVMADNSIIKIDTFALRVTANTKFYSVSKDGKTVAVAEYTPATFPAADKYDITYVYNNADQVATEIWVKAQ